MYFPDYNARRQWMIFFKIYDNDRADQTIKRFEYVKQWEISPSVRLYKLWDITYLQYL